MRILRFFFLALLWILVVGSVVFFVGREAILLLGAGTIKSDYQSLLKKNYSRLCAEQFSYSQEYFTQLRFVSDKEYNLEVVCVDFDSTPILIESKKLLPLLFKESFGSGFVIDERKLPAFIKLKVLGRSIYVHVEDQTIHLNYLALPDLDYDQGPTSSCQAHNYQCCNSDLQSGLGKQTTQVNDCPKSCYESCLLRPVFLSFNSRPPADQANRVVELAYGEAVTFSYFLGNGKDDAFSGQINKNIKLPLLEQVQTIFSGPRDVQTGTELALPLTVTIDFGDGKNWQSSNFQDSVDHVYTCQNQTCFFQVRIIAKDAKGISSVDNEVSKMIVKIHR